MTEKTLDCLSAGIIVVDHVCDPIERLPHSGELVLTAGTSVTIGGCSANMAVDLARCGRSVSIAGVVGQDPLGDFSARFLESAGVDLSPLVRLENVPTSASLIVNVRGDDRRFIHSVGANAHFDPRSLSQELVSSARILYLGGYCITPEWPLDDLVALFKTARAAGTKTVLDVVIPAEGEYWSRIAPLLRHTDLFLPNDDEAAAILGPGEPLEQARRFRSAGAGEVIVTCGERGLVALGEETVRADPFPVEFVDGTGSGDAFCAGYILGMLEERPFRERIAMGSALGASCVQSVGATTGVFDREQLAAFLATHSLTFQN